MARPSCFLFTRIKIVNLVLYTALVGSVVGSSPGRQPEGDYPWTGHRFIIERMSVVGEKWWFWLTLWWGKSGGSGSLFGGASP